LERFGGKEITWGLSECLLVHDGSVYATSAARSPRRRFRQFTGDPALEERTAAQTRGGGGAESASYTSPILVEFAGRKLLIGCSLRHLFCIDTREGRLEWTRPMPTTHSVLALMPVLVETRYLSQRHTGKAAHYSS